MSGVSTDFVSNTVIAERGLNQLSLVKRQTNVTSGQPVTGQIFVGTALYTTGPLLFASGHELGFVLNYVNNGSGTLQNVTIYDQFPT